MKYLISAWLILTTSVVVANSEMKKEIDCLLTAIEESSCQFFRNGKIHSPQKAVSHIKRKYEQYANDIDSTEIFIELSATMSSMSGKAWPIACPNKGSVPSKI